MTSLAKCKFDAFLSYSHSADNQLAPSLQIGLERLLRNWYEVWSLRIFRDRTNLSLHPNAWAEIERNLAKSRWLLLLASPQAAKSKWCGKEIDWWIKHKPRDNILLILTDGDIYWDQNTSDFDWLKSDALHPSLRGVFENEPLWLDMRWAKIQEHFSSKHTQFRDALVSIAAALRGVSKDTIDSEAVSTYKRNRWWAISAIAAIFCVTTWAQYRQETALILAGAKQLAQTQPTEALLVLAEMDNRWMTERTLLPQMSEDLWDARLTVRRHMLSDSVNSVAWLPNKAYAAGGSDGVISIWSLDGVQIAWIEGRSPETPDEKKSFGADAIPISTLTLSPDATVLSTTDSRGCVRIVPTRSLVGGRRIPSPPCVNGPPADGKYAPWAMGPNGQIALAVGHQVRIMKSDRNVPLAVKGGNPAPVTALAFDSRGHLYALTKNSLLVHWHSLDEPGNFLQGISNVESLGPCNDGSVRALTNTDMLYRFGKQQFLPEQLDSKPFSRLSNDCDGYFNANGDVYRRKQSEWQRYPELAKDLTHNNYSADIAFSKSGNLVAVVSPDASIRVTNLQTKESQVLRGHVQRVFSVAFDPDERLLLSAGVDATVRVFDLSQHIGIVSGHYPDAQDVFASTNGTAIVSRERFYDISVANSNEPSVQPLPTPAMAESAAPVRVTRDWAHGTKFFMADGNVCSCALVYKERDCPEISVIRKLKTEISSSVSFPQARVSQDGRWLAVTTGVSFHVMDLLRSGDNPVVSIHRPPIVTSATFGATGESLFLLRDERVHSYPISTSAVAHAVRDKVKFCLSSEERQAYLGEWKSVSQWRADRCNNFRPPDLVDFN